MKYKARYTRAVVIVHGQSEEQICKYIKNNLKIKISIYKNPKSSIQINDLKNLLNNEIFKDRRHFLQKYDDIEVNKKELKNFKIFIIMDTDDCTATDKERFIGGTMFKKHWAYKYIVPIYNIDNLESAMMKLKIEVKRDEKRDYIKIFPTDRKYQQLKTDIIQITDMRDKLSNNKKVTNLDEFLEYCLNCTECI